jgi:hypothetical protein
MNNQPPALGQIDRSRQNNLRVPGSLPGCLPASLEVCKLNAIDKAPLIFQIVESSLSGPLSGAHLTTSHLATCSARIATIRSQIWIRSASLLGSGSSRSASLAATQAVNPRSIAVRVAAVGWSNGPLMLQLLPRLKTGISLRKPSGSVLSVTTHPQKAHCGFERLNAGYPLL